MSGPYIQQLSGSYIQQLRDRIDFIEFKQNILFLKPPHHKAPVFAQLSLDEFISLIKEDIKSKKLPKDRK